MLPHLIGKSAYHENDSIQGNGGNLSHGGCDHRSGVDRRVQPQCEILIHGIMEGRNLNHVRFFAAIGQRSASDSLVYSTKVWSRLRDEGSVKCSINW